MEHKHTPGPWRIDTEDKSILMDGFVGISADTHYMFAQVAWRMEFQDKSPDCEANASLIAAAPELLDALKKLSDLYDSDEGCRSLPEYKAARAAIAKATGAQQ